MSHVPFDRAVKTGSNLTYLPLVHFTYTWWKEDFHLPFYIGESWWVIRHSIELEKRKRTWYITLSYTSHTHEEKEISTCHFTLVNHDESYAIRQNSKNWVEPDISPSRTIHTDSRKREFQLAISHQWIMMSHMPFDRARKTESNLTYLPLVHFTYTWWKGNFSLLFHISESWWVICHSIELEKLGRTWHISHLCTSHTLDEKKISTCHFTSVNHDESYAIR
jgi:hypothetical protein